MSKSESCSIPVNLKLDLPADQSSQIAFNFELPKDGLSLRSARYEEGKAPELVFEPSANVPTIQEQDVAVCFRLAAEGKRPEFFYLRFPPNHPLHDSRWFMQYSPEWLRYTDVGKLLADADWNMKSMNVGVRTNEEKTVFQSWEHKTKLNGLASSLDFPIAQLSGPIILSCKKAVVQKSDTEIHFPEEPKMQIVSDISPGYTEYITKHYESVGYHDEPKFLKVRELIKLVLVVEWLYAKGVRMNEDWIKMHTSKPSTTTPQLELGERKKPPCKMVPRPTGFKQPSNDVKPEIWKTAGLHRFLKTKYGEEQRYGYSDFGGSEVAMFKKEGTKYKTQKSMKFTFDYSGGDNSFKGWVYLSLPDDADVPELLRKVGDKLRQLSLPDEADVPELLRNEIQEDHPAQTHQEIAVPLPESVDTTVDLANDGTELVLKVTNSILPSQKKVLTVTASIDNYNKLFASMDPNMPIPGEFKTIIPGVKSWEELISELSVPFPGVWQAPFLDFREPTATGGVSTSSIPVREEPMRKRQVVERTEWKDNYKRSGLSLSVRATAITAQAAIQLVDPQSAKFAEITRNFLGSWIKGTPPSTRSISVFSISNSTLEERWTRYSQTIRCYQSEPYYHGTTLACDILNSQQPCRNGNCGICGIACAGMDPKCIRKNADHFQRFGEGYYLAPNASKCNDYTLANSRGYKAMLLCDVIPGRKYNLSANRQRLTGPPSGYNSVYGQVGDALNYPELVVYNPKAVMPRYMIVYK